MEDEFYIPVDSSIESFLHHINSHDRTILSAKYGDGKTYFLSKFMQSEEVRKEYEFITLYPINYQILENRDIIDVIKFDILMQMFAKGMIDKNADYISDNVALGFFIRSNSLSIFESLLAMISCLGLMPETQQTVLVSITGIKVFKDLKKKYEEFKKKQKTKDEYVEEFLNKIGTNGLYDFDVVTHIIRKGIDEYRKNKKHKKIAIVIEDMDRLDPAHLFRIMNVFTAQMDNCYHLNSDSTQNKSIEKFGFDNVIFVMDYNNTHNIFKHIYGSDTNFDGYINKFCDKGYFKCSLKENMKAYFLERICAVTGMNLKIEDIPILFDSTLVTESTIRCVSNSMLDVSNQIIKSKIPNLEFRGKIVNLSQNVLRLLVVLRRLNLCIEDPENEKIKGDDFIVKIIKEQLRGNLNSNLWHYFLPYFLYFMNGSLESCIWFKSDKFNLCGLVISCINEDGSVEFEQLYQLSSDGYKKCDYDSVIRKMLNCIAK